MKRNRENLQTLTRVGVKLWIIIMV